jgi:hypothetical protein
MRRLILTEVQLSVSVFSFSIIWLVTWTWGEAMSSFTHHLQVWMVKCSITVVACLFFYCLQWLPPFGLIQPWTKEKAAWINHRSTAVDSTRKGTHHEMNQPGLIQPSTREKAAWINHKSTAVDSTINCSWFQIDLQFIQAEINCGRFN